MAENVWTCEACGESRPDELIEVASGSMFVRGVQWTRNVKYCSDRPGCGRVAEEMVEQWRAEPWPSARDTIASSADRGTIPLGTVELPPADSGRDR